MRILIETPIYLWYLADSRKLTATARKHIAAADEVYVSAVTLWEASIKVGIGKLDVDPDELVAGIEASGFIELPIYARHTIGVLRLPELHRDPFDRLLIAQALYEPMRFLTADAALKQYSDLIDVI